MQNMNFVLSGSPAYIRAMIHIWAVEDMDGATNVENYLQRLSKVERVSVTVE